MKVSVSFESGAHFRDQARPGQARKLSPGQARPGEMPRGGQRDAKGGQKEAKGRQGTPRGRQGAPKGSQREAKGTPKGAKGRPRGGQGRPKGGQGEAKGGQKEAQGRPREAKGGQSGPIAKKTEKPSFEFPKRGRILKGKWCQKPANVEKTIP